MERGMEIMIKHCPQCGSKNTDFYLIRKKLETKEKSSKNSYKALFIRECDDCNFRWSKN